MNTHSPIDLNSLRIKSPVTTVVSILHRLSGCFLFLLIPAMLWVYSLSLKNIYGFSEARLLIFHPVGKLLSLLLLTTLFYHMVSGIRYTMIDIGRGNSVGGAYKSGIFILVTTALFFVGVGYWIW